MGASTSTVASHLTRAPSGSECGSLGYFNGFKTEATFKAVDSTDPAKVEVDHPFGGSNHDGDRSFNAAPFSSDSMGIQGSGQDGTSRMPFDLRQFDTNTNLHLEVPWCRWFGAPITVPADLTHPQVDFCTFQPDPGERLSVVGDWIVDEPTTEIHDARILVAVRADRTGLDGCSEMGCMTDQALCLAGGQTKPTTCADPNTPGCPNANLWHLLASGYFGKDTAQEDELDITVPIPASTDPTNLKNLVHDIPDLAALSQGCKEANLGVSISCDEPSSSCTIQLKRNGGPTSVRSCIAGDVCPCTNRTDVIIGTCNERDNWIGTDACHPSGNSTVSFAKDIRVEWKDPMDAWQCDCAFTDPSKAGATIIAPVQGCTAQGRNDDETEDVALSCGEVCAGAPQITGGQPASRLGAGLPGVPLVLRGQMLARNACDEASEVARVSPTGDFEVALVSGLSSIQVGEVQSNGNFNPKATTNAEGAVFLSLDPAHGTITISELRLKAGDFTVSGFLGFGGASFSNTVVTSVARATGTIDGTGVYVVPVAHLKVAVETTTGDARGTSILLNQGPAMVRFDVASGIFVLDGQGADNEGRGVVVHLVGTISNRPPLAVTGPDRVVECQSNRGATVTLDGRGSTDPDPADTIAHYQWFEQATGLGNDAQVNVVAGLGSHTFTLHVYDPKLGSSRADQTVRVVDTTPPSLQVAPNDICVWPPNHDFLHLRIGVELQVAASDACDPASVSTRIVAVTSDEAADANGSGNTSPDFVFGPQSVCVRAERAGPGDGRHYTVVVEAKDSSGNTSRRNVRVVVPHDASQHQNCVRADGMKAPDARCSQ